MRGAAHLLASTAAVALVSQAGANAQTEQPQTGARAATDQVVVTARRRETVLSVTPVSATAFSGEQLEDAGIGTLDEIAVQTPNFNYVDTGLQPRYRIRGDGLQVFNDTSDSPVGFAVDEVFYGAGALQRAPLYDIQRVEVLRGPQGTLFGRNTTAGLVNVFTNQPTEEHEGYLTGQFGSFKGRLIEGGVSGGITDNIRGRASFYYNEDEGFQTNLAIPDGVKWSKKDVFSARVQLSVDLTPDANLLLKAGYTEDRSVAPMTGTQGALDPDTLAPCSNDRIIANECVNGVGFMGVVPRPERGYSEYDGMPNHLDFAEYSARFNWDITPSIKLVSITGYLDYDRYFQEDGDGWAVGGFLGNAGSIYGLDAEQFSQELQLHGETGIANWVLGGFYYNDDRTAISTIPEFFGDAIDTTGRIKTESFAGFVSVDAPVTETVSLEAGGRFTNETKELDLIFAFAPDASYEVEVNEFTWRTGANWRPIDPAFFYFNAATGYKSPDFNTTLLFGDASAAAPTEPETSFSLEAGGKLDLGDGRFSLSAAIFRNRVKNKQATVTQIVNDLPVARLFNFGEVEIRGAELEFAGKLAEGLTTKFGVSLLDTEIHAPATTTYSTGPASDVTPIDGNELPATPEYTFNGLVRYDFPEVSAGNFALQGDFNYIADQYFQLDNNERDTQDAYGVLNLRAFWRDSTDRYSVQVFVENVTDTTYASYVGTWNGFDTRYIWWGLPRTWGVRAGVEF